MKYLLSVFLVGLFIISTAVLAAEDEPEIELDEDGNPIVKMDMAPEWMLVDGEGGTVSSALLANKPYVLHFWATWNPYSKKFQPGLDSISIDYVSQDIPTYAVSWWENPGADPKSNMEKRGLMLPVLVDGDAVAKAFGVIGVPTTIFVNHEGEITHRHTGFDPNDPQIRVAYEELKAQYKAPPVPVEQEGDDN